jgi:hypothetical protein
MGNINSHNPFTDSKQSPRSPEQYVVDDIRSLHIRYYTIELNAGRLGQGIPFIVNTCIRKIQAQTASIEYVEAVLNHIHNKVQEGNVDEVKGGKAVLAVVWATRWPHMASITSEERIALEIMRADAISRLSMKARRGW